MNTMFIEVFTCAKLNFYLIDAHDDSSDRPDIANEFAHSHLNHAMPHRKHPKIPTVSAVYAFTFANTKDTNDRIGSTRSVSTLTTHSM